MFFINIFYNAIKHFHLNLGFTLEKPIHIKKVSQFFHGKIGSSEIFQVTNKPNQTKPKFQTKYTKLTEKKPQKPNQKTHHHHHTFDRLTKTGTAKESCCSTRDPTRPDKPAPGYASLLCKVSQTLSTNYSALGNCKLRPTALFSVFQSWDITLVF